jgi:hypothetical protein
MTVATLRAITAQEEDQATRGVLGVLDGPVPTPTPSNLAAADASFALEDRVDALSGELAAVRRELARLSRLN